MGGRDLFTAKQALQLQTQIQHTMQLLLQMYVNFCLFC